MTDNKLIWNFIEYLSVFFKIDIEKIEHIPVADFDTFIFKTQRFSTDQLKKINENFNGFHSFFIVASSWSYIKITLIMNSDFDRKFDGGSKA